jgi:hypothetical protein
LENDSENMPKKWKMTVKTCPKSAGFSAIIIKLTSVSAENSHIIMKIT